MNVLYNLVYFSFKFLFRCFYHHKIYGLEHFPNGPAVIASNHNSYLDPLLLGTSCPEEVYYFAKATLFDNPFLKYFITRLNAYPVKGSSNDLASFKLISSFLKSQNKVIIFPEGLRSVDGQLSEFKHGIAMLAFRANCPIMPVYIHGTYEAWNRSNRFPKLKGNTACVFGEPIDIEAYKHLSKKEAQERMTQDVKDSVENLRQWYETHHQVRSNTQN
jgi:1-acyl-sn-glycerol-3-phosphate acyltransferase